MPLWYKTIESYTVQQLTIQLKIFKKNSQRERVGERLIKKIDKNHYICVFGVNIQFRVRILYIE